MVFSCTKRVIDKIGKYKEVENVKEEIGLYNWYVDLINLERKNYFLFTNSKTLFSFFVYAGTKKELEKIEGIFEEKLKEQIVREVGTSTKYLDELFPEKEVNRFVKTNSRSVLGSMNDFKHQIRGHIWHKGKLNQTYNYINHLINRIPMGGIKNKYPKTKMKEELESRIKN